VTVLHEYALPWGKNGWRGVIQGAAQRFALPPVVSTSSALVVTTDERADWLRRRIWLPRRATAIAPVFSNLPDAFTVPPQSAGPMRIGMFGYPPSSAPLIAGAMARLLSGGTAAELWLLGTPGPNTTVGEAWRQAGTGAGIGAALRFTGVLRPAALAGELSRCHILVFDDGDRPSSRKGTLASALASGRPVVAVDGARTWSTLVRDGAIRLVTREPAALGDTLLSVLSTPTLAARLQRGAIQRSNDFSDIAMVGRFAELLSELALPTSRSAG
jgi:hypothetical protein